MRKPKILLADTDCDVGNSIREYLKTDYTVVYSEDMRMVLPGLHQNPVDLAVLNVDLSNSEHFYLLKQIRETYPRLPLIITYVFIDCDAQTERNYYQLADAIFLKPYNVIELAKRIHQFLGHRVQRKIIDNRQTENGFAEKK